MQKLSALLFAIIITMSGAISSIQQKNHQTKLFSKVASQKKCTDCGSEIDALTKGDADNIFEDVLKNQNNEDKEANTNFSDDQNDVKTSLGEAFSDSQSGDDNDETSASNNGDDNDNETNNISNAPEISQVKDDIHKVVSAITNDDDNVSPAQVQKKICDIVDTVTDGGSLANDVKAQIKQIVAASGNDDVPLSTEAVQNKIESIITSAVNQDDNQNNDIESTTTNRKAADNVEVPADIQDKINEIVNVADNDNKKVSADAVNERLETIVEKATGDSNVIEDPKVQKQIQDVISAVTNDYDNVSQDQVEEKIKNIVKTANKISENTETVDRTELKDRLQKIIDSVKDELDALADIHSRLKALLKSADNSDVDVKKNIQDVISAVTNHDDADIQNKLNDIVDAVTTNGGSVSSDVKDSIQQIVDAAGDENANVSAQAVQDKLQEIVTNAALGDTGAPSAEAQNNLSDALEAINSPSSDEQNVNDLEDDNVTEATGSAKDSDCESNGQDSLTGLKRRHHLRRRRLF